MSDVQPIANFCWDTVSPVTPETEPQVEVTAFSVTGVDTRTGPVTLTARDDSFGVADIYGEFGTNSCTVEAPEGVLIYDPSGTFGTPYGPKALLNAAGTYYWRPGILEPGTDEEQKVLFRDYGVGTTGASTTLHSQEYESDGPGTFTFTVPAGVSILLVEAVGGGGGGGGGSTGSTGGDGGVSGGGGGGGALKFTGTIACSPGDTITINTGAGGGGGASDNPGNPGGVTSVVDSNNNQGLWAPGASGGDSGAISGLGGVSTTGGGEQNIFQMATGGGSFNVFFDAFPALQTGFGQPGADSLGADRLGGIGTGGGGGPNGSASEGGQAGGGGGGGGGAGGAGVGSGNGLGGGGGNGNDSGVGEAGTSGDTPNEATGGGGGGGGGGGNGSAGGGPGGRGANGAAGYARISWVS